MDATVNPSFVCMNKSEQRQPEEVSNKDILDAMNAFAQSVQERFEQIDQRFEQIDQRFEQIDQRFEQIDQRFEGLEGQVTRMGSQMVTKDYLDDKLGDLRGNITIKFNALTDAIECHDILSSSEVTAIKRIKI